MNTPVRLPQVKLNELSQVVIDIEARRVPPGTVVDLEFFMEDGIRQVLRTTPLAGKMERSTATATVPAFRLAAVGYVRASWNWK